MQDYIRLHLRCEPLQYRIFSPNFYYVRLGWTALSLAAHKNNAEVAKLLCDSQANVDLRCEDGRTAVAVAVQTGK